jgi:hypothetical protein
METKKSNLVYLINYFHEVFHLPFIDQYDFILTLSPKDTAGPMIPARNALVVSALPGLED